MGSHASRTRTTRSTGLRLAVAVATFTGLTVLTPFAEAQTPTPDPAAIIDNGVVQLGVHPTAELNVGGGPPSMSGTSVVGIRYLPTNGEATSPGCLCEGWGAADATSGATGFANQDDGGAHNLELIDFQATESEAVSVVEIPNGAGDSVLRVTHDYHPSTTDNLYEVTVTIENVSDAPVEPRYRRVMDWDVEPTATDELVTIDGAASENLLFSSNDGFATANPLGSRSNLGLTGPPLGSFFQHEGPDDHGALFDFGFDTLAPGGSVRFNTYYGAAGDENAALLSLDFVGATIYSLGQPSGDNGGVLGAPHTFMFGFGAVGGEAAPRLGLRKRADSPRTEAGEANGYTITMANPTDGPVAATNVVDTLPPGFTYVPGSATLDGAALADPVLGVSGDHQTLTWAGPLTVPSLTTRFLHFVVLVADDQAPGEYRNLADADAVDAAGAPVLVRATGSVAPVHVPPPTVASEVDPSADTGSLTIDPDTGEFVLSMGRGARSDLTVTSAVSCPDGSAPSAVDVRHNGVDYAMAETPAGSGTWSATIPGSALVDGPVEVVATCGVIEIPNVVGKVTLYDPSGIISDASTGAPISGATVTLHKKPFATPDSGGDTHDCRTVDTRPGGPDGDWSGVAPGDPGTSELADPALEPAEMSPLINPQVTGADGRYGWDVALGCWFVVVEAPGYHSKVSALVGVPPEVLDLHVALAPVGGGGGGPHDPSQTYSTGLTATSADPLVASIFSPNGGPITAVVSETQQASSTNTETVLLSRQADITAPDATAADPLVLTFRLHSSMVGDIPLADLVVMRNGQPVAACVSAARTADPDPCVAQRATVGDEVLLTVHTSRASTWTFGQIHVLQGLCDPHTAMPFRDVPASNVHRGAVACAAGLDIVRGVDGTTFAPGREVTRGQLATMITGMLTAVGHELPAAGSSRFDDIVGNAHRVPIQRLAASGVIKGLTPDRFGPDLVVTRAQAASMLQRAHDLAATQPLGRGVDAFRDDNTSVHQAAINAVADAGIAQGTGEGTFSPDAGVRRDQMSSFLVRTAGLLAD